MSFNILKNHVYSKKAHDLKKNFSSHH